MLKSGAVDNFLREHSMVNEVTIRIGGESGEGTISGGDILALAAARWGYHVYTFRTFPAEILGGPCLFQVRISDQHVKSIAQVVESKLSRSRKSNPILMEKNMQALDIAKKYVTEQISKRDAYQLGTVEKADRVVLNGNQAVVAGALSAHCGFFAGYPITPASDIMEGLAKELPQVGGTFLQAEDEIAALAAVVGASFSGVRAMTATSGPGFSLMTELIGYASMAEIPVVIVDAQRAGPSTGMPTKTEQSDLNAALYASHGDTPRMVVAPANVAECYSLMVTAFNIADRYQMPVIFLTDQSLTARVESVDRDVFQPMKIEGRIEAGTNGQNGHSNGYTNLLPTEA